MCKFIFDKKCHLRNLCASDGRAVCCLRRKRFLPAHQTTHSSRSRGSHLLMRLAGFFLCCSRLTRLTAKYYTVTENASDYLTSIACKRSEIQIKYVALFCRVSECGVVKMSRTEFAIRSINLKYRNKSSKTKTHLLFCVPGRLFA